MKWIKIFLPVALSLIITFIFKIDTDYYNSLNQPSFAPKPIVFAIVWPIIYLLMGISHSLIKEEALETLYYIQLLINLLWSPIFFTFKALPLSAIWIITLDIVVIFFLIVAYKKRKSVLFLNLPYLLWLLFATYLNITIYYIN